MENLNSYDVRSKSEALKNPWYQRLWNFLGSDPDWQRLALDWAVLLVTYPDDLEVRFEVDRSTVPGVFNHVL